MAVAMVKACTRRFAALRKRVGPFASEHGIALVMALGIIFVLGISTASATYYVTSNLTQAGTSKASTDAYSLAETGINDAVARISGQLDPSDGSIVQGGTDPRSSSLFKALPNYDEYDYPAEGGKVFLSGSIDANYVWTITSVGQVKNGGVTQSRTLTRQISVIGINDGANGNSWSRFYQDATTPCLTIDNDIFVTNVATKGDLCIKDNGGITGSGTLVDVGGNVIIEGPPTTTADRFGSSASGWTNSTNVYASDSVYATNAISSNATGATLSVSGFGFTIPSSAVIKGVTVKVIRKAGASSTIQDSSVYLQKAGTQAGTNHAISGSWSTSNATQTYGSTTDLWGTALTAADVNNSGFGVKFTAKAGFTATTAYVDSVVINVTYSNDTNGVGTSAVHVKQAQIGGTCKYNANTAHTPCTTADHIYADTISTVPAVNNGALDMPDVDFNYWWANAKPGPKHFCTNPNPGISPSFFDNNANSTTGPDASITINGEMAPATTDYDCQVWEDGVLKGQMSWNHTTHIFTVSGTIFIDGNFRFDEDGEIVHYVGRATIMSSRDDEIDALVCAGGSGTTYSTSCLTNMASWNTSQNMLVLMSNWDNEYDQGGSTCAGSPPSCYGGHPPAGFQGILYSHGDCLIHQQFMDSGPVICNTITLPNEGGGDPTFYTFPSIGNLTNGMLYSDTSTATNFMLSLGPSSG